MTARKAFTIVELLVTIAVISVLIALLLPAVQSARESARRTQCLSRLKQIGLALHNYHDVHRVFPPAAIRPNGFVDNGRDRPRSTWAIAILPYVEQQPLFESFNPALDSTNTANLLFTIAPVPAYTCPTDTGTSVLFEPLFGALYSRGNYAAVVGSGSWGESDWKQAEYRGVMGQNAAARIRDISDGSSNTVCVAEIRSQPLSTDNRGAWAFPAAGSANVSLDCDNICRGLNDDSNSDWIPYCGAIPNGLSCNFQNNGDSNAGPRSLHSGGIVQVSLSDGSARGLNETMDRLILRWLFTASDGEVVGAF